MQNSVWDSLGTWLLGNNQDGGRQSAVPRLCSLKAAFLEFRPQIWWKLIKSEIFQTKHLELIDQCFSMKLHFIIMYQINCIAKSSSFSLFLCFPFTFILLVLPYFIAPLLAFPSSCAFKICLKHSLYLPNLKTDLLCHFALKPSISVRLSSLIVVKRSLVFLTQRENIGQCHEIIHDIINFVIWCWLIHHFKWICLKRK